MSHWPQLEELWQSDTHELELALTANDAMVVHTFLHILNDDMVRACANQIRECNQHSDANAASIAANRARSNRSSSSMPSSASELKYQSKVREQVTEAMLLVDDERDEREGDEKNLQSLDDLSSVSPAPSDAANGGAAGTAAPPEHSGVSLYHSLWSKRVCIMKTLLQTTKEDLHHNRKSRVANRINSSNSSISLSNSAASTVHALMAGPSSSSSSTTSSIPPLLRWGILSLFPLIDSVSKNDPALKPRTIKILVDILQNSPPLSLLHESEDAIQQMMALIRPTTLQSEQPQDAEVVGALIGLSLQRGSLRHILASLLPLLKIDASSSAPLSSLNIQPYLRSLKEYQQHVESLSILSEDSFVSSWKHHTISLSASNNPSTLIPTSTPAPAASPSSESSPTPAWGNRPLASIMPYFTTMATDGTFNYLHNHYGLTKVGTGFNGSIQGHIYSNRANFVGGDIYKGFLAFANGQLFYRSNNPEASGDGNYLATILSPDTLADVGQLLLSDEQMDTLHHCESGSPLWLHMITDGRLLYFLRRADAERNLYTFTVIDPATTVSGNEFALPRAFTVPRIAYEVYLPNGFTTNFPSAACRSSSLEELICPNYYFVGQEVDAKDSVNKWCPAVVLQVTPSRVLLHYVGWASKWDEWKAIDSNRIAKRGEYTDASNTSKHEDRSKKADENTIEWQFRSANSLLSEATSLAQVGTNVDPIDGNHWVNHLTLNSDKFEAAFTSKSMTPFIVRTHRREYIVHLSRMIQIDTATNQIYHLRRVASEVGPQNLTIEDLHFYTTGRQIVAVVPNKQPTTGSSSATAAAQQQEVATLRVFEIPSSEIHSHSQKNRASSRPFEPVPLLDVLTAGLVTSAPTTSPSVISHSSFLARWLSDAPLPLLSSRPQIVGLVTAAHLLHSLTAAICYDARNDIIWSYNVTNQKLSRFINSGPAVTSAPMFRDLHPDQPEMKEMESKTQEVEEATTQEVEEEKSVAVNESVQKTAESSISESTLANFNLADEVLRHLVHSARATRRSPSSSAVLVGNAASVLFEPFSRDVSIETFDHLLTMLRATVEAFNRAVHSDSSKVVEKFHSILCHVLELTRGNFTYLDEFSRIASDTDLQLLRKQLDSFAALLQQLSAFHVEASLSGAALDFFTPSRVSQLHLASQRCLMAAIRDLYPTPQSFADMLVTRVETAQPLPANVKLSILCGADLTALHRDELLELLLNSSDSSSYLSILFESDSPSAVSAVLMAALTSVYTQSRQLIEMLLENHTAVAQRYESLEVDRSTLSTEAFHPSITSSVPLLISSAMRLLVRLQRGLFSMIDTELTQSTSNQPSRWFSIFQLYVEQVYALSASLLQLASDSCVEMGFNRAAQLCRDAINEELQVTMIGLLVPTVSTFVSALSLQGSNRTQDAILLLSGVGCTELQHVLHAIDRWNVLCGSSNYTLLSAPTHQQTPPPTPGLGSAITSSSISVSGSSVMASNLEFHHLVFETPHPYTSETLDKTLSIKGAIALLLEFDERSATKNLNENLTLRQVVPPWQKICSGPSVASVRNHSGSVGSSTSSKWPSQFLRRSGDNVHLYWAIEPKKDSEKEKEKEKVSAELEYGFKMTVHAYVPHPSPRVVSLEVAQTLTRGQIIRNQISESSYTPQSRFNGERVSWNLDVELGLATMLGILSKPWAVDQEGHDAQVLNPTHASHPLSPLSSLFAASVVSGPSAKSLAKRDLPSSNSQTALADIASSDSVELNENAVDSLVDMQVVAMGQKKAPVISSSAIEAPSKEELLLQDLMDADNSVGLISLPNSPDRNNSAGNNKTPSPALPYSRVLIDWVTARLSGRPALSASSKKLMMPCEAKLLGMLLWHTQLLKPAADLLSLIQEEGVDITPQLTPKPSPSLGPSSSPSSNMLPPLPSSPSLTSSVSQMRRKTMSPAQTTLFNQLKPVWQSVYKIEQWILNQSQLANQWNLFIEETKLSAITQAEIDIIQTDASNRSSTASPSASSDSLLEAFILLKLNKLPVEALQQFCQRNQVDFRADNIEYSVKKLMHKVKAIQIKIEDEESLVGEQHEIGTTLVRQPSSISSGANSGLEQLTRKINGIAGFVSSFDSNELLLNQVGLSSMLTKLSAFVFNCIQPGFDTNGLSKFVATRQERVQQRIQAYTVISKALTVTNLMHVKESLLSCIPSVYYSASLKGCTHESLLQLKSVFTTFLQQLIKVVPANNGNSSDPIQRLPSKNLLKSIMAYAELPYDALHDASMLSQVSLLGFLAVVSKVAIQATHASVPLLSSTSLSTTCSIAFTSTSSVEQEIWECVTCNLVNGSLCCRVCALTCHKGHNIRFKHRGRDFCHCGMSTSLPCKSMQHIPAARLKKRFQHLATQAMNMYRKLVIMCLQWDSNSNPDVASLHTSVIHTILRVSVKEVNELYASSISSLRSSPHFGPLPSETAAKLDESFLHHLLVLCLKSRKKLVRQGISIVQQASSSNGNVQLWMEYLNALLVALYAASTRLQRIVVRLLKHLLPITPPAMFDAFDSTFSALSLLRSPYATTIRQNSAFSSSTSSVSSSSESVSSSTAVTARMIVAGLITLVGDLLLRSSPQQHNLQTAFSPSPFTITGSESPELTSMQLAQISQPSPLSSPRMQSSSSSSNQKRFKIVLHNAEVNSVNEMETSSNAAAPQPTALATSQQLTQVFLDRFTADILECQRAQQEIDSRANSEFKSPDAADDEKPFKKLESSYATEIRSSLDQKGEAVVFVGMYDNCRLLASKVAASGLVVSIAEVTPDPDVIRNHKLIRTRGAWNAWQFGGKQCVEVSSDCILILRYWIQQPLSAWSDIAQEQLAYQLHFLDSHHIFPEASSTDSESASSIIAASLLPSAGSAPLSDAFVAAFGAVSVIGGNGNDIPRISGPAWLTVKDTTGESLSAGDTTISKDDTSDETPLTVPSVSAATVTSPWRLGHVLHIDDGSSELLMSMDEDPRRAASRVHVSKVRTAGPLYVNEYQWAMKMNPQQAIAVTKRLLHALQLLRERDVTGSAELTASSEWRWVWSLLQTRLLRAICVLIRRGECGVLLLTKDHAPIFQWITSKAFYPFFSDYRTVAYEWCRGMERLIDLRLAARQRLNADGSSLVDDASHVSPDSIAVTTPTAWDHSKASHCLLEDSDCSLLYTGGLDANHAGSNRRFKKSDVLPSTLIANHPFTHASIDRLSASNSNPIVYFELTIVHMDPRGLTIGLCPDRDVIHHRRVQGWSEHSFVINSRGSKGEFIHRTRNPCEQPLEVGDLIDVKDNVGKWEVATVLEVHEATQHYKIKIHYVDWSSTYDEVLNIPLPASASQNDRVAVFGTHTKSYLVGQLFLDSYASFAPTNSFQNGDVIGCGWNRSQQAIFFTYNGRNLGTAFSTQLGHSIPSTLYPAVTVSTSSTQLKANFEGPFAFQGLEYMQQQQIKANQEHQLKLKSTADVVDALSSASNGIVASSESGTYLLQHVSQPEYNQNATQSELLEKDKSSASIAASSTSVESPAVLAAREEKAINLMNIGVLPDATLQQLMHALKICGDEIERAVAYAYEHPQLFANAEADASSSAAVAVPLANENESNRGPRSPRSSRTSRRPFNVNRPLSRSRNPHFPPSQPSGFGGDSSYSSDADQEANEEDEHKNSTRYLFSNGRFVEEDRLAQSPTPLSTSNRALNHAATAAAGTLDEETYPIMHSFQHNALAGPHNSNDYIVAEQQEMASATELSSRRPANNSLDSFLSLLAVSTQLVSASQASGGERSNLNELLDQLRQVDQTHMENVWSLLIDILPNMPNSSSLNLSHNVARRPVSDLLGGSSPATIPEPRFRPDELAPGLRVRISKEAKKSIVMGQGLLNPTQLVPWLTEMDGTIRSTGVIKQLDRKSGIALVEFLDVERSRVQSFWYPLRVLTKIVSVRTNAFLGLNHSSVIHPHLTNLQSKAQRHHARQFLSIMAYSLSALIQAATSSVQAHASKALLPSVSELTSSPFLKLHFPAYCRDILMVASMRALEKILYDQNFSGYVLPPIGLLDSENRSKADLGPAVNVSTTHDAHLQHLLRYLVRQQPQLCVQSFQHTLKLLQTQSKHLHYENNDLQPKYYMPGGKVNMKEKEKQAAAGSLPTSPKLGPVASSSSSSSSSSTAASSTSTVQRNTNMGKLQLPILWSTSMTFPAATCIAITFLGKVCLPAGVALQFYGNVQCTRLLYAFSGPKGAHAQPTTLPPFVSATNCLWLKLVFNPELSMAATSPASLSSALAPYDTRVFFSFHASPISDQFAMACLMANSIMNQYAVARRDSENEPPSSSAPIIAATPASTSRESAYTSLTAMEPPAPLVSTPSSPSSQQPNLSSAKTEASFLFPVLKQIFSECLEILSLNASAVSTRVRTPTLLRIQAAQLMTCTLSVAPRGSLGDLSSLLPIVRELMMLHRTENKISSKLHEREQEVDINPSMVLYSNLFQALTELLVAMKTYGSALFPPAHKRTPMKKKVPIVPPPLPPTASSDEMKGSAPDDFDHSATRPSAMESPFENPPPVLPDDHAALASQSDDEVESIHEVIETGSTIDPHQSSVEVSVSQSGAQPMTSGTASSDEDDPTHHWRPLRQLLDPHSIPSDQQEFEMENMQLSGGSSGGSGGGMGVQAERWARIRGGLNSLAHQRARLHREAAQAAAFNNSIMQSLDSQLLAGMDSNGEDTLSHEIAAAVKSHRSRRTADGAQSTTTTTPGILHTELYHTPDYVNDLHYVATNLHGILYISAGSEPLSTVSLIPHAWHLPARHAAYTRAGLSNITVATSSSTTPSRPLPHSTSDMSGWGFESPSLPRTPPAAPANPNTIDEVNPLFWPIDAYFQLAQLLNVLGDKLNISPLSIAGHSIPAFDNEFWGSTVASRKYLAVRKACGGSLATLRHHARCLQQFNALVFEHLTKVDLTAIGGAQALWNTDTDLLLENLPLDTVSLLRWNLAQLVEISHGMLCTAAKVTYFHNLLQETAVSAQAAAPGSGSMPLPGIRVNRLRASEAADRARANASKPVDRLVDTIASVNDTLFGQVFQQLRGVTCALFRRPRPRGAAPHVAFQVLLEGETVLGQAGPWRVLFQDLAEELQECKSYSDPFPLNLFVPTPNSLHGVGESRGAFLPHPSATSAQQLELYEFVGRLLGIAIRTRALLSLNFPGLFWALLTGRTPTRNDLREVDQTLVDSILVPLEKIKDEQEFQTHFGDSMMLDDEEQSVLHFPVTRSDNSVPLPLATGSTAPVTFASRLLYAQQLETTRLFECSQQIAAIRRGLSDLLPLQLLPLFSPAELELLCCGRHEVDIPLLKRHTEYASGLSEQTEHIQWFWDILENEFTNEQKQKFIKFTYAQERLPTTDAGFDSYPKIRMLIKPSAVQGDRQDNVLPHAETCFFNLQLPAFSSRAIMKERLLTTLETVDFLMSGDDSLHADTDAPRAVSSSSASSTTVPPFTASPPTARPPPPLPRPTLNTHASPRQTPSGLSALSPSRLPSSTSSTNSGSNSSSLTHSFTSFRNLYSSRANILNSDRSAIFDNFHSRDASLNSSPNASTAGSSSATPAASQVPTATHTPASSMNASSLLALLPPPLSASSQPSASTTPSASGSSVAGAGSSSSSSTFRAPAFSSFHSGGPSSFRALHDATVRNQFSAMSTQSQSQSSSRSSLTDPFLSSLNTGPPLGDSLDRLIAGTPSSIAPMPWFNRNNASRSETLLQQMMGIDEPSELSATSVIGNLPTDDEADEDGRVD